MIIGNGDIASTLAELDKESYTFFASGVSNSKETREPEYRREIELLMAQDMSKHIVYFSSLSVFYSDTRYTKHKRKMEELIKIYFPKYTIVRLGNITWGNNPHTLINYFRNKLRMEEPFEIKDTYRYIIDKEEFLHWMKLIPNWSCEMNLTGKRMKIVEILKEYCDNSVYIAEGGVVYGQL